MLGRTDGIALLLLLGWLYTFPLLGCSDEQLPPAPGGGSGRPAPGKSKDGGGRPDGETPSQRPDGPPVLPTADEERVLPQNAPALALLIEVDAIPEVLDVHFSVDTTSSMDGEIDELQRELHETVVPELSARVADVAFGVSAFQDFPRAPFGSESEPTDTPFILFTPLTTNLDLVTNAVARLDRPLGFGGDNPESDAEALWQIATGEGYRLGGMQIIEAFDEVAAEGGGRLGGVGFRDGALRVVLHVTDAPSHEPWEYEPFFPGTHSLREAGDALSELRCNVVSIVSTPCEASTPSDDCDRSRYLGTRAALEQLALRTSAVTAETSKGQCTHGVDGEDVPSVEGQCPLVFDVSAKGEGLSRTLIDAITGLVDAARFDVVHAAVGDDPVGFVERIVPILLPQPTDAEPPMIEDRLPEAAPDGILDSFVGVRAKTRLAFEVWLRNRHIAATDVEQRFRVIVQVLGDGLILSQRTLRVVIPAGDTLAPSVEDDAGR